MNPSSKSEGLDEPKSEDKLLEKPIQHYVNTGLNKMPMSKLVLTADNKKR